MVPQHHVTHNTPIAQSAVCYASHGPQCSVLQQSAPRHTVIRLPIYTPGHNGVMWPLFTRVSHSNEVWLRGWRKAHHYVASSNRYSVDTESI